MRKLSLLLFVILVWLQCAFWLGKNNIFDYWHVNQEMLDQEAQNEILRQRNMKMFAEIDDLSHGYDAIEERARSHLGMIKSGEIFYRIIQEKSDKSKDND